MIKIKSILTLLICIPSISFGMQSASSEDECPFITFAPRPTIPLLRVSSDDESDSSERQGDWEKLQTVDVLSFDAAKGVYYYHPLLSYQGKRRYELLMVNEGDERKEIDLGPLRYFALRKKFQGCSAESNAPYEKYDEDEEQRIKDLGAIAFDEKRKMFFHTKTFDVIALLAKKELETTKQDSDDEDLELPGGDFPGPRKEWPEGEERLNCVDIMSFDSTIGRYYYESLFYNYETEVGCVLTLCSDTPKTINLGPLKYFATQQIYWGREGNRQYFRYDDATEAREEGELGPIQNDFERNGRYTHAKTFVRNLKK